MPDSSRFQRIQVIDSHTGGEPTRVVVGGGPNLGQGSIAERRILFQKEFDQFRSLVVNEPRGSDLLVGALLCEPVDPTCVAGVIFFNNVGPLWMCGHGTIGLAVTLGYLGRIGAGIYRLETAVGPITFEYDGGHRVSFENVPSYRFAKDIVVEVEGIGLVTGDVAWGGNWFFLAEVSQFSNLLSRESIAGARASFDRRDVESLIDISRRIRKALSSHGITGENGCEIDHIELFGLPGNAQNQCRNFVLCPGQEYDRSPCGTGTSAKLACLFADHKLKPGEIWRQESICGSVFEGSIRVSGDLIVPRITGTAYIISESTLLLDPADSLQNQI